LASLPLPLILVSIIGKSEVLFLYNSFLFSAALTADSSAVCNFSSGKFLSTCPLTVAGATLNFLPNSYVLITDPGFKVDKYSATPP